MFSTIVRMNTYSVPDTLTKLTRMGDATLYERAGDSPEAEISHTLGKTDNREHSATFKADKQGRYQSQSLGECIKNVSTPQGSKPILATMLTTACERNCYYCPFRAGRTKTERVTITPDALAKAFDELQRKGSVDGLFLSSGIIKGSVTTQDKLIDTADMLRNKYRYKGYIHLKVMPGAEYDQLHRAMQLADRVSVNLEGATEERLNLLAPKKDYNRELVQLLQWAAQIRRDNPHQKLARPVTQFVVGAVGDTDLELLSVSEKLYRQFGLARAYYSAFGPIVQTPLENVPRTAPIREHRLYQASFLLRDYGWNVEDLPFENGGNLSEGVDPKKAWADTHLTIAPIEIMTATREQLMRVPGIGAVGADAIIKARVRGALTDLDHLRKIGIRAPERAAPYVLLNGRKPTTQLTLF
jgi:predicted DNA-binding helix-hairpin-helix protein